ncbi:hypothetical protein [Bacillus sp. EB01]|uniref:hypothetical protein n=1 Tax=Bacillus sp. EB01 TaxID=1347086 RepID=UPI0005C667C6|nr:hypothetical protein [Bacillus sp. EB01]
MEPVEVKREIIRFSEDGPMILEDTIVTEYTVTIKVNGQEFVTMVCSLLCFLNPRLQNLH